MHLSYLGTFEYLLFPPCDPNRVPLGHHDPWLISAGRRTAHPAPHGPDWQPGSRVGSHDLVLPCPMPFGLFLLDLFDRHVVLARSFAERVVHPIPDGPAAGRQNHPQVGPAILQRTKHPR